MTKNRRVQRMGQQHLTGTADCNRVIKLDCIGHV